MSSNSTDAKGVRGTKLAEQEEGSELLTQILEEGRLAASDSHAEQAKGLVAEFVRQVTQGQVKVSKNMEAAISARIAEIDRVVSRQLNEIMHAEPFQRLEASWRGLHHLVRESETSPMLKIRVLNVSKKELLRDLENAVEFDQSALFRKIYEEEFGTFGGAPYGALIGDYEFDYETPDMALLEKISNVAAAANAPFFAAAAPKMFGWKNFTDMTYSARSKIFASARTSVMSVKFFQPNILGAAAAKKGALAAAATFDIFSSSAMSGVS